jgi:hypothetical protein
MPAVRRGDAGGRSLEGLATPGKIKASQLGNRLNELAKGEINGQTENTVSPGLSGKKFALVS